MEICYFCSGFDDGIQTQKYDEVRIFKFPFSLIVHLELCR